VTSERIEALAAGLAAGKALSDADADALAASADILTLGMLADEARRRRHGARTSYVRVAEVTLPQQADGLIIPAAAGEIRVTAEASAIEAWLPALRGVAQSAAAVPVTACSLADLQRQARSAGTPLLDLLRSIRRAGATSIAEAPLDLIDEPEAALEAVREAGLGLARLTIHRPADAAARLSLIRKAAELQHALGWLRSFAPLPRSWSASSPTTGYEDVRQIALARLVADNIPSIQVDWSLYGPKLAQVALTVGADDLDAVSAIDDESEGRRRAPLEEVRRNIRAAALEPVERDGDYRRMRG
jgi:aminodeoxyfutalosine synthase